MGVQPRNFQLASVLGCGAGLSASDTMDVGVVGIMGGNCAVDGKDVTGVGSMIGPR